MRIVLFGTYQSEQHPRVQVLKEGLAALGHEVLECNAPLELDTAARVRMLRRPWRVFILGARLSSGWLSLWRAARGVGPVDAVVVPYLGHFDVHLARRRWRRGVPIALDYFISGRDTAIDRGISSAVILWVLGRIDRSALAAADFPFVDTEGHRDMLPEGDRPRAAVVPIGAPGHWFKAPKRSGRPLRVVFHGTYTPLQGAPVIGEAIGLLDPAVDLTITMIGMGQDRDASRAAAGDHPGVTWMEWVAQEEMPAIVASHDVCLGIFGTGPKALRVVPNKVFQGAAAGCAIVTSDTGPQREALADAAVFVPPGNGKALAEALAGLAADSERVWALREGAYRRAQEAFRPAAVTASLDRRLEEAIASGGRGVPRTSR
jgi:glycosyltransferase involved in cell wall biosynthesis